ncbi:MAG: HupE/UreJ family protein [Acidobacteriota bacterium]|nr:HupE/UreJ family protein [Acidobacteriota bacterium]
MRRPLLRLLLAAAFIVCARPADAHPAPFSYLDFHFDASGVTGTLVVHDLDAAHDLNITAADTLLDPAAAARVRDALVALLSPRLSLLFDGRPVTIEWSAIDVVAERQSLRLAFAIAGTPPARMNLQAYLFPYDLIHQTFINIYENGALKHQAILDATRQSLDYYSGTTQGRLAVIRTFVLSGIAHILIGPDHILFLIGLLLLGGTVARLALIVTAFTIGHSITLSLAALDILSPPSRYVEPLIALTIVVVGADNILVLRPFDSRVGRDSSAHDALAQGSDIRAWLAAVFGLIHGFGFASVLKEFGLPQAALGWSLFAFNLGVEAGQLAIVSVVASALALVRRGSERWAARVALAGSIAVILAGLYWFVERVFLTGGV